MSLPIMPPDLSGSPELADTPLLELLLQRISTLSFPGPCPAFVVLLLVPRVPPIPKCGSLKNSAWSPLPRLSPTQIVTISLPIWPAAPVLEPAQAPL